MPLIQSGSKEAREKNIETEIEHGKDPKQAVAIGYATQRRNQDDEQGYFPVTGLTLAEINANSRKYWGVGQQEGTAQETPEHEQNKKENIARVP